MTQKHHKILIQAPDFHTAGENVLNFFDKAMLLHYDRMNIVEPKSSRGDQPPFWPELEKGLADNLHVLNGFVQELKETGFQTVDDLNSISQGYPSKLLHIIAHLLDGFIGIDTIFYNLLEDSHGLSPSLKKKIAENSRNYWLIHLEVFFDSTGAASIIHT